MSVHIPVAAHAPPLPPPAIPRIYWIGAGISAVLSVLCVFMTVGIGISLSAKPEPAAQPVAGQNVIPEKPEQTITKPSAEWNYQDIQDHLAQNGMKTKRCRLIGGAVGGMYYRAVHSRYPATDVDLALDALDSMTLDALFIRNLYEKPYQDISPEDYELQMAHSRIKPTSQAEARQKSCRAAALWKEILARSPKTPQQDFVATEYGSADVAGKEAARIKDVEQRDVLAWSRFVFRSHPAGLATLKQLLP